MVSYDLIAASKASFDCQGLDLDLKGLHGLKDTLCLQGLIRYSGVDFGLKGLIWSSRSDLSLKSPSLGLKDLFSAFRGPQQVSRAPARPLKLTTLLDIFSLHFLIAFDKRRLGGYEKVSNCNRAQKPNILYIWA
jgi:hypothetical protein